MMQTLRALLLVGAAFAWAIPAQAQMYPDPSGLDAAGAVSGTDLVPCTTPALKGDGQAVHKCTVNQLAAFTNTGNVKSPSSTSFAVGIGALPAFSAPTITNVAITGTGGQFSCTCTNVAIGEYVTISGTLGGTGSITGYSSPTRYLVALTNGTSTFTLYTTGDAAIFTTTGTLTGLTYTLDTIGLGNNAFGNMALATNAGASFNNAFGNVALANNTTGNFNNAFGAAALQFNTTGTNNNAFGAYALYNNTGSGSGYTGAWTGTFNSAFGDTALYFNTTGYNNSAFGATTLDGNTTGHDNSAGGFSALQFNTTGSYNTAWGSYALSGQAGLSTGSDNSAFGVSALGANTTGYQDNAFGFYALNINQSGIGNNAFGYYALSLMVSGNGANAFGENALLNSTGTGGTAMGNNACKSVTTGTNNNCFGYGAGSTTLTTGSNNNISGTSANCTTDASGTNDELKLCTSSTGLLTVTGGATPATSAASFAGTLATNGYAIGSLPTCNGGLEGTMTYVTNGQTSPTYLGTVSTTGAVVAPVFCNGSGWVYH
jgi:hypothetical protein